jgi:muramoyltetrapeptide carboxypeptidase
MRKPSPPRKKRPARSKPGLKPPAEPARARAATPAAAVPIIRPAHLLRGRTVALVAPSFSFDATLMEAGRAHLESKHGLKTVALPDIRSQEAYFAGSDDRRLEELFHWLTDPGVHALVAVRGGYGCARLYPRLAEKLRAVGRALKPKIVLGYSDLTVLLNGLHQDFGWITFHGPVLSGRPFRAPVPIEETTFHRSLFTAEPLGAVTDPQMVVLNPGRASGPIVGGCLSLVASSLGTSYELNTDGKILFLEDVDEAPYRLDRMLTQLLHAGKLDRIKGLVFGQMTGCEPKADSRDPTKTSSRGAIELAVAAHLRARKIPAVLNFPAGHGMPQVTFPIGATVELRADDPKTPEVVFREAGTR